MVLDDIDLKRVVSRVVHIPSNRAEASEFHETIGRILQDIEDSPILPIPKIDSGSYKTNTPPNSPSIDQPNLVPLDKIIQEVIMRHASKDESTVLAEEISEKYGVEVKLVDTNAAYYSDDTIFRTARDNVYFVSREEPRRTAEETKRLIKYNKFKYELANANRIEKAAQKSLELGERIERIKNTYKDTHAGKEPSLRKIAAILNEEKVLSPGGKRDWAANSVKRIIEKAQ